VVYLWYVAVTMDLSHNRWYDVKMVHNVAW